MVTADEKASVSGSSGHVVAGTCRAGREHQIGSVEDRDESVRVGSGARPFGGANPDGRRSKEARPESESGVGRTVRSSIAFPLGDPGVAVGTAVLETRRVLVDVPVAIDGAGVVTARTEQHALAVGWAVAVGREGGSTHCAIVGH